MTINATEARKQAENLNSEESAKIIGAIDSQIEQAVYNGDFTITTQHLTQRMKEAVINHYTEYGYEIVDYKNNMLGINW